MSPSTSYSLYPCCISFLASLPLSPQCSHSIAGWAVRWRVAAPFQSVTGQICSRWDLSWVQLGFCPTHPFKPAKKNKPLDDRMHRLSMSTWPRRCHGARWRAHSTLLPYPTSKWTERQANGRRTVRQAVRNGYRKMNERLIKIIERIRSNG